MTGGRPDPPGQERTIEVSQRVKSSGVRRRILTPGEPDLSIVVDNVFYRYGSVRGCTRASDDPGRCRTGRRLDRHRVQGDQRAVRRRRRDQREGPGGDPRPGLRVEPGRPQPAQPPDQRDRDPGLRHRAVQRRAPQGRGPRDQDHRLRARGLLQRRPRHRARRLGEPGAEPAQRHPHRRRRAGHPDGRGRLLRRSGRRRRPPHRPRGRAHRRLRQPARRPARHRAPPRASATAGSASSVAARTSSPPGCASSASATR